MSAQLESLLTLEGTYSADLDFDGNVNFADLAMFRIAFGTNSVLQGGTTGVIGGTGGGSDNVSLSEPSALGMFAAIGLVICVARLKSQPLADIRGILFRAYFRY